MNKLLLATCAAVSLALTQVNAATNSTASTDTQKRPMALMVMLDGWRADLFENGNMPNIRKLAKGKWLTGYNGAYTTVAHTIHDAPASSAANHTAIATGVTATKTGIKHNTDFNRTDLDWTQWPSWLLRLVRALPEKNALFVYSWKPDSALCPDEKVEFMHNSDEVNAKELPLRLASQNAPDATLFFIDLCDHAGHTYGFYPYTQKYLDAAAQSDAIVGECIKAIASRPTFAQEDWIILLTADHGGYDKRHGLFGGHATTIPIVVTSKHVTSGEIPGFWHNYDLTPTALAHFGLDVSAMNLDGKIITGGSAPQKSRALTEGLIAYLPFDDATASNNAKGAIIPEVRAGTHSGVSDGVFDGCLRVSKGGGVLLKGSEKIAFENNSDFTISLWVKMPEAQEGDPVIVCNKDWRSGCNPGIALIAAKCTQWVKTPGVCVNLGLNEKDRLDMGTYDVEYGKWTFYALSRSTDGILRVYQGTQNGTLYMMAENASAQNLFSGLPFYIGQDGTGKYVRGFNGDIDEFAFWSRSLSLQEIQLIYHNAQQNKKTLGTLFNSTASVSR